MKTSLFILVGVGMLWLAGLAFQSLVGPAFALDAVVPAKVLAASSPEERKQMQRGLQEVLAPSRLSWIGATSVLIFSITALWQAPKKAPIKSPDTTRGK